MVAWADVYFVLPPGRETFSLNITLTGEPTLEVGMRIKTLPCLGSLLFAIRITHIVVEKGMPGLPEQTCQSPPLCCKRTCIEHNQPRKEGRGTSYNNILHDEQRRETFQV